ncbi:MAG: alcohol dehydrogenase catalytic domain-containing protein [bacterium]|nr:MAG: alcohol dehydrogenase catalytic domain-containing protein [bacterium]
MKAVMLTGIQKMEIWDIPKPKILKEKEVLLKIASVGVCGSDVHYYSEGKIGDQIIQYPFTIGHECSAVVNEIGVQVTRVKPGDKVAIDPAVSCGRCSQCWIGRSHTCLNLRFLGCPGQLEGCLTEYIVMPEQNCYIIPQNLSLDHAALIEPMSIGFYAMSLLGKIPVQKIGILGAGPIGLSVLLAAKDRELSMIFVTDKINTRLEIAKGIGAKWIGNPNYTDIVKDMLNYEPSGLDAVFECCGDQNALDQAIDLLQPGGRLIIVGIPREDRISFDINLLRRKEIIIQNVRRQNNCTQKAIDFLNNNKDKLDFMITHRFQIGQSDKAFDLVANYLDGVVKAVIQLNHSNS